MAGRAVEDLVTCAQGKVVGNRDRLVVGDEETVLRAGQRGPGAHPGGGTGSGQVDGAVVPIAVALRIRREVAFVGAPAQFGRLLPLAGESVDGPGVDEFARPFGRCRHLGVALGDVDHLDTERVRQLSPFGLRGGHVYGLAGVARDVEQGLLDEMRHQARIGTVRQYATGCAWKFFFQGAGVLAQRVVGALRGAERGIGVKTGPGFNAGVDVAHAVAAAPIEQRRAADIDRDIEQQVAGAEPRCQNAFEIRLRQGQNLKGNAVLLGL